MVKKLYKHELLAYMRSILPINLILIAVAVFTRVVQFFESDTATYNIIFGSSVFVFVISIIVSLVLSFIMGIKRFYTNLFTNEGYLTLTLPVTPAQHVLVKFTVATAAIVFNVIMILTSLLIVTSGEVCSEIFKALGYILSGAYGELGFNLIFYIIETLILGIVYVATSYLLFYACISIGQRAKKNRVAAAVGVYFIYYAILQVLSTIGIIIINAFSDKLPFEAIGRFIDNHPEGFVHIFLCGAIVITALVGFAYFMISKYIIKKKLNIE